VTGIRRRELSNGFILNTFSMDETNAFITSRCKFGGINRTYSMLSRLPLMIWTKSEHKTEGRIYWTRPTSSVAVEFSITVPKLDFIKAWVTAKDMAMSMLPASAIVRSKKVYSCAWSRHVQKDSELIRRILTFFRHQRERRDQKAAFQYARIEANHE